MQYRPFGKLDEKVSALGFGCMRLPTLEGGKVDETEAIRMIRHAIDEGVDYVDTAWPYHGGQSEVVVGKALADGYRERVKLATKLPVWEIKAPEDMDRIFEEQLRRLQTEQIDFYLLHSLGDANWAKVKQFDMIAWGERKKAEGKIRYLGYSFHASYELFAEIMDAHDWDFVQIQYNYMNEHFQAGTRGLELAASRGLGVIIMEPLLGGRLAEAPEAVQEILAAGPVQRTPAEWSLQWLWNKPEVATVLSGMSAMEHVEGNLASAKRSGVGVLSEQELAIVERARAWFESRRAVPCTSCRYCMPCPNDVDIPGNFLLLNEGLIFGDWGKQRFNYNFMREDQRANNCIQCRICEEKCPQSIEISEELKKVHAVLGEKKDWSEVV